jgi:hypothetical protein
MARSLNGIDQTLKVLKYAVELNGTAGALPALREQGLLPPSLVFVVAIADRDGRVVASNPEASAHDVSGTAYFLYHRDNNLGLPFVGATVGDSIKPNRTCISRAASTMRGPLRRHRHRRSRSVLFHQRLRALARRRARHAGPGRPGRPDARAARRRQRQLGPAHRTGTYGTGGVALHKGPDGVLRYTSVQRLHGFPLAIVVGLSRDEQFAPFNEKRRPSWPPPAASALLLLVVAVVSGWAWQLARVRRRARRAQETYAAASEGSLDAFFVLRVVPGPGGTWPTSWSRRPTRAPKASSACRAPRCRACSCATCCRITATTASSTTSPSWRPTASRAKASGRRPRARRAGAGCTARWWRSKTAWSSSCATSPSASRSRNASSTWRTTTS